MSTPTETSELEQNYQLEIEKYKASVALQMQQNQLTQQAQQTSYTPVTGIATIGGLYNPAHINPAPNYQPGAWINMGGYNQIFAPPFKMGVDHVIGAVIPKDKINDYFALGNPPEEGVTYKLVASKVELVNDQYVIKFKLV